MSDVFSDVTALVDTCAVTLDEVKAYVDEFLYNLDIDKIRKENLAVLASDLGVSLENVEDYEFNKKNVILAVDSYKAKGTVESIKILFYTLGFDVDVVPLWTPDYKETAELSPPYLVCTLPLFGTPLPGGGVSPPSPYTRGTMDVSVVNPDGQFVTKPQAYKFVS